MRYPRIGVFFFALTAAVPAVAVAAAGPAAADPSPAVVRDTAGAETAMFAAIQRDLGIAPARARQLFKEQAAATTLEKSLRTSLGSDFGGSYFDAKTGKLTVSVTDATRTAEVTGKGATTRVVRHGEQRLDAITGELDALTGRAEGKTATRTPSASGKRAASLPGVIAWSADTRSDSVRVTLLKGSAKPAALNKYGDAIRLEYLDSAPQAAINFVDGGDALFVPGGRCSIGFNLRNPSTGQGFVLTAGHCVTAGDGVNGSDGTFLGTTVSSFFPNFDDALIRNDNSGYWLQGAWIDTNPSNGPIRTTSGYTDPPVGALVCKSGSTTLWTCGFILQKNETLTLSNGQVIFDETRHSACVEPGDSGGANVVLTSAGGWTAAGVTSAAQLYSGRCGQFVGVQSISWYYPASISVPFYQSVYGAQIL
jgi:streptogrisin C